MPNVFLRSRPTRITADALCVRLEEALARGLPGRAIHVEAGSGDEVILRWEDGPAAAHVAEVVAGVVNWEVRSPGATASKPGVPAVVLARRFSPGALAVAVVRYQASHVRPYDSGREDAGSDLAALLDVDDPTRSGYPVPDAMAELLLAAPDPADLDERLSADPSPADRLSVKLDILGYDHLWHAAWSAVT